MGGLQRGRKQPEGERSGKGKQLLASSNTDSPPASVPLTDVLMLLMTDVLVFLQEKDQKYIFPALVRPSTFFLSIDKCFRPFLLSYPGQEILQHQIAIIVTTAVI